MARGSRPVYWCIARYSNETPTKPEGIVRPVGAGRDGRRQRVGGRGAGQDGHDDQRRRERDPGAAAKHAGHGGRW